MVGWGLVSNYPPADNREPTRGPSQGWRITNTIINHNGDAQSTSPSTYFTKKIEERCQTRKLLSRMPFWLVDTNMYVQASRQETEGFQKVSSTFDSSAWGWPVASGYALAQVGASNHLPAHHSGRQVGQAGGAPPAIVWQMQPCQGCNGGFFLTKC